MARVIWTMIICDNNVDLHGSTVNGEQLTRSKCDFIYDETTLLFNMGQYEVPLASTADGKLIGKTDKNLDGDTFFTFLGIPYGQPPVNELRFKPPLPVKPWEGVRNATEVGSASIGRDDLTSQVVGSEDCLYLNVYTKTLPGKSSTKLRPVMVYIHGGGFVIGSSRPGLYGPEFLMLKDIVLVTLNYRLGILGFLSIDGTEVYGNMGLKDQVLALKWVQRNIKSFNGDPNNVTVFGESAGSASVHGHVLSPASKGLFHKAILQSGCTLNSWFWGSNNNAREIVKNLGKTAETEQEALEILMRVPAMDVFNAQEKIVSIIYPLYTRPFSAVVETPNESAFLSKHPRDIMREGSYNHVPLMIGYTQTEGMLWEWLTKENPQMPEFELGLIIPFELDAPKGSVESTRIIGLLESLYSSKTKDSHYDELTDANFLVGIMESLVSHLETAKNPIYLYRMSIMTQLNRMKAMLQKLDEPGVSHADDLGYLFSSDITPQITPGSLEDKSLRTFVELWTNFADVGNPSGDRLNVSWPPVESFENLQLLDIGEQLLVKDIPERKRLQLWRDIYKQWLGRK